MRVLLGVALLGSLAPGMQTEDTKLVASDASTSDKFGFAVSLSSDTLAIGSFGNGNDHGAVYLFEGGGASWTETTKIDAFDAAPGDWFGYACALDGNTLAVGARADDDIGGNSGSVYVYVRAGTTWSLQQKLTASDGDAAALLGDSIDIDGDTIVAGSYGDDELGTRAGAAYVFTRTGTAWSEQAKLTASDGAAIEDFSRGSIAIQGDTIVVGKIGDDTNGDNAGAIYVFTRSGTSWSESAKLVSSDGATSDNFGASVAIDGSTMVVGTPGDDDMGPTSGSVYVFVGAGPTWSEQAKLVASDGSNNAQLGESVAVEGDRVFVGAQNEANVASGAGSAYEFVRTGTSWIEQRKLVASDAQQSDTYGGDVTFEAGVLVVGAQNEDDGGNNAGAAYVHVLPELFEEFCSGDGGDQAGCTNCPCGNNAAPGTIGGCINAASRSARILATGLPSVVNDTLRIELTGGNSSTFGVLTSGASRLPANMANPCFGLDSGVQSVNLDGLRCVGQGVLRHGSRPTDAQGDIGLTTNGWGPPSPSIALQAGFIAGQGRHFQVFYREQTALVCQTGQNTSNGVSVTFVP